MNIRLLFFFDRFAYSKCWFCTCRPTLCYKTVQTFQFAGLPDEMIEKGKDIKSISEIVQNGNDFKVTVTTGPKVMTNSFTIGQECEIETLTGEKVKVSVPVTLPGKKL